MTAGERGFLLLASHLGNPDRKPLTTAQFRTLAQRVRNAPKMTNPREMVPGDLTQLGYGTEDAKRITALLEDEDLLEHYLRRAKKAGCTPLTRVSEGYPQELRIRLGNDAPAVLWCKGDPTLLRGPKIALVGSRQLLPENAEFAREAGIQAARQGFSLVSGNASGADRTAQDACLESGGTVICVVADALKDHTASEHILYLSEDSFDFGFSPIRALSRNRLIHSMGIATLVAQSSLQTGGTWDGSVKNLRFGWTPLFCFDDGRQSTLELEQMGASRIQMGDLLDMDALIISQKDLFHL